MFPIWCCDITEVIMKVQLTLSQTSPGLQYRSFENTVGKGEIARDEQFLLFPQCFLTVRRTFCHFHQVENCRLQTLSICTSLEFVIWERVKYHTIKTKHISTID